MTENLQSLISQREELDQQIKHAQQNIAGEALAAAERTLDEAGVHPELAAAYFQRASGKKFFFGGAPVPKRAPKNLRAAKASGVKVAPKYRHKLTGVTWTGRGKQPAWYAAAEQSEIEYLGGDLA